MKYLKKRNNSDALYYQRRISKHLVAKAAEFNLSNPITRPLNLKASKATDVQIATKLEQRNREFEDLMRLVEGTDLQALSNAVYLHQPLHLEFRPIEQGYAEAKDN